MKTLFHSVIANTRRVCSNLIEKGEIASLPAGRQGFPRKDNFLNQNLAILKALINGFEPRIPSQKGIGCAMSILRSEFGNFLRHGLCDLYDGDGGQGWAEKDLMLKN